MSDRNILSDKDFYFFFDARYIDRIFFKKKDID